MHMRMISVYMYMHMSGNVYMVGAFVRICVLALYVSYDIVVTCLCLCCGGVPAYVCLYLCAYPYIYIRVMCRCLCHCFHALPTQLDIHMRVVSACVSLYGFYVLRSRSVCLALSLYM